jgi:hypothetical protein
MQKISKQLFILMASSPQALTSAFVGLPGTTKKYKHRHLEHGIQVLVS